MFSLTQQALENFDNQHDFERMCAAILIAKGCRDVVPIAPRGGSDGGRDITFITDTNQQGLACVTLRKDIEKKFREDFSQRSRGEYAKYYFFCNIHLTSQQKDKFVRFGEDNLGAELTPQDIEAIRILLDSSELFRPIKTEFLRIPSYYSLEKERDELRELINIFAGP